MRQMNVIQLLPTGHQKKMLKEMMVLSSCIYNMSNYVVRNQMINGLNVHGYFNLKTGLQKSDNYQRLGRSYSSPRIQQYSETVSAMFRLMKSKKQTKVGLPKYCKDRKRNITVPSYLVMDGCQFKVNKTKVRLPLSRYMRNKYLAKQFRIKYNGILRHQGKQCRSEIHIKDKKYYLHQSIEIDDVHRLDIKHSAGLDLGVKRLVAIHTESGFDQVIGRRRFFRQWQHHNKLIADEQSRLAGVNRKISNRLSRLYSARKKYQRQLFDNVISNLFRKLKRHKVQQIFVGDIKHIKDKYTNDYQDMNNLHQDKDARRRINSMMNNYWSYDIFYAKLFNKATLSGITVKRISEEYTSVTCPECKVSDKGSVNDRQFVCTACGHSGDRDIIGATNILDRGMHSPLQSMHRAEVSPSGVSA